MYDVYFSDEFRKHLNKLTKRDSLLRKRVFKKIEEMRTNPLRNSMELDGDFKGKHRVRVGDYRLVYEPCDDCRKKGYEQFNKCFGCDSRSSESIVYFDVLHRSSHEYDT